MALELVLIPTLDGQTVSADGGKTMAPWVRRAWDSKTAPDSQPINELVNSLQRELHDRYPSVGFDVQSRNDNVIVSWVGPPAADDVADALDVDPLLPSGEVLTAMLYGEDLPDDFVSVTIVVKQIA